MTFGERLTQVRKRKNLSQAEIGKKIGINGNAYGRYERNDNSPSIEMAIKLAQVFDVSLDFLMGIGKHASFDKSMLKRFEDIENLDSDTKNTLYTIIDTFLRDAKARKAYS